MEKVTVNQKIVYTPELTEKLIKAWGDSNSLPAEQKVDKINQMSVEFDIPKKNLIGKLSREKVYTASAKSKKSGENRAEISEKIGELTGMDEKEIMSIETSNKGALLKIYKALTSVNVE